jgi:YD repeat-containing protein
MGFEDSKFGQRTYEYDPENQLLAVNSEQAYSENFAYDGAGNRIRWNQETATFNALNQLIQQGTTRCQYDARGHLIEIRLSDNTWHYTFNQQNLLVRAKSARGTVVTFGYDAFGRRIWKRCGDKEVRYVWMGETLLGEVTYQAGVPSRRQDYLYKPGTYTPLATQVIEGQVYCYHTDHLGTPRRLTDGQGKMVWAADYSGFGQAFVKVKEVVNCLRFPGQYWDEETGLHYNRFRYYLP